MWVIWLLCSGRLIWAPQCSLRCLVTEKDSIILEMVTSSASPEGFIPTPHPQEMGHREQSLGTSALSWRTTQGRKAGIMSRHDTLLSALCPLSVSASQSTWGRPACRLAMPAGSSTAWNMGSNQMGRCPVTRPSGEGTTPSTPSLVKLGPENMCPGQCLWIWSPLWSVSDDQALSRLVPGTPASPSP